MYTWRRELKQLFSLVKVEEHFLAENKQYTNWSKPQVNKVEIVSFELETS